MIRTAQTRGSGWVDYAFPKPGRTQPSTKWSYVKRVQIDGVPALIAAGFYPESLRAGPLREVGQGFAGAFGRATRS